MSVSKGLLVHPAPSLGSHGTDEDNGLVFESWHRIATSSMTPTTNGSRVLRKALLELALAGVAARRVDVDVDALSRWCQAEGRSPAPLR
jgi:hypothetical protein